MPSDDQTRPHGISAILRMVCHSSSQEGLPVFNDCFALVILLIEMFESLIGNFSSKKVHCSSGGKISDAFPLKNICFLAFGFPQRANRCTSSHDVGKESLIGVWGRPAGVGVPDVSTISSWIWSWVSVPLMSLPYLQPESPEIGS